MEAGLGSLGNNAVKGFLRHEGHAGLVRQGVVRITDRARVALKRSVLPHFEDAEANMIVTNAGLHAGSRETRYDIEITVAAT